jgi:hypothetical protein
LASSESVIATPANPRRSRSSVVMMRRDCEAIRVRSSSGYSAWLDITSGTPARIAAANGVSSPRPGTVAAPKSVLTVERPRPGKCLTVASTPPRP